MLLLFRHIQTVSARTTPHIIMILISQNSTSYIIVKYAYHACGFDQKRKSPFFIHTTFMIVCNSTFKWLWDKGAVFCRILLIASNCNDTSVSLEIIILVLAFVWFQFLYAFSYLEWTSKVTSCYLMCLAI